MSKGKFALGAIIGAAAGIVAGILTAPKAGKDTRADLKERAMELKKEAGVKADNAKQFVDDAATDLKDKALDVKERSERAFDGAKKEFESKE